MLTSQQLDFNSAKNKISEFKVQTGKTKEPKKNLHEQQRESLAQVLYTAPHRRARRDIYSKVSGIFSRKESVKGLQE